MPAGTDGYAWWNDTVFYEIFVRSFYDSNGDGIGDLNGITAKLDYLQTLGVRGLWLMPIHPSPSYHGYDVIDYYAINPQYGTMDDFKNLLGEAHKRGIRIVIDFVLNHTSDENAWFTASQDPASPYRSWYVWSDQNGGSHWHIGDKGFYYGYFTSGMPDLNYNTPEVGAEMLKVTDFWLKDVGIDGFRLDAAKYLYEDGTSIENTDTTHQWYQTFRAHYKATNPQAMTIGEVWDISPIAASYAQGDQLDLTFNFKLAEAFIVSARVGNSDQARTVFASDHTTFKPGQVGVFLTNHDQNRVVSQVFGKLEKARVAASMYLASPGVPFVYYGEEIGMIGSKPDEMIRTPMQWSAEKHGGFTTGTPWELPNTDYTKGKNVAEQLADPQSLLNHYQALINLRNQHAALRVGDAFLIDSDKPEVFALLRVSADEAVLAVVNLSDKPLDAYQLSLKTSSLKGAYQLALMYGDATALADLAVTAQGGFNGYRPAPIPAYGTLIVQLQAK